mgnify:CR=1 FL=1
MTSSQEMSMNDETKKTRVHVEIDSNIHYMMRVQAVKEQLTIRKFVEKLIVNYVESTKINEQ